MRERWKPVVGYATTYEVSSLGRVRRGERILKDGHGNNERYVRISLLLNGVRRRHSVHTLVLRAFRGPPPPRHEGRHLDGNRRNNRLKNLRWSTHRENKSDELIHGTRCRGVSHGMAKLSEEDVYRIRKLSQRGLSQRAIGRKIGISQTRVQRILTNQNWKHLK